MKKILVLVLALSIGFMPGLALAADWYADEQFGGCSNNCGVCDGTTPCCDLSYIFTNCGIAGGDDFYVAGVQSNIYIGGFLSGTSGNRTTFNAWTGGSGIHPTIDGFGGTPFAVDGADYISLIGLWTLSNGLNNNIDFFNGAHFGHVEGVNVYNSNGNGIRVLNSTDMVLRANRVSSSTTNGVYASGADNLVMAQNRIMESGQPGATITQSPNFDANNNYFSNNSNKGGLDIDNGSNNGTVYYNSFYGQNNNIRIGNSGAVSGLSVTDNSFYINNDPTAAGIYTIGSIVGTYDYNNYYRSGAGAGNTARFCTNPPTCSSTTNYSTIANWRSALGGCPISGNECGLIGTSVTDDPQYTAPASNNLDISASSPLLGIALNVGIATDIKNNVRPSGGGYDIGANEYDDPEPSVPEFTLFTLMLALFAGLGVLILVSKLNKSHSALN